jgi:DNA repair exonuclease SbcCD ATPase subunit
MADFIDEHLRNLSARRGQLFTAVQAARTNDDNIAKVKKEMVEKEALLADLQVLEKALSPLNGVIAEGMFGFITAFIELMNTYIGSHWHDPLTVMPCKLNETGIELDYLFPVQTLRETPNDISECSSGQKEIIDWAFREAGMLGLGLSTHPVLFDEWGVRMDEAHKNKTCELLGDLTDRSNHDQVIIVSHLKMVHDALGDVRQLVLCDRNISISGNYNDHAILK